jgi:hypothetical protein
LTLLFLFHQSLYQRRKKFKWSKKKPSLGLALNLELNPSLVFFLFVPSKLFSAPKETWMEQKKVELRPNSKFKAKLGLGFFYFCSIRASLKAKRSF